MGLMTGSDLPIKVVHNVILEFVITMEKEWRRILRKQRNGALLLPIKVIPGRNLILGIVIKREGVEKNFEKAAEWYTAGRF